MVYSLKRLSSGFISLVVPLSQEKREEGTCGRLFFTPSGSLCLFIGNTQARKSIVSSNSSQKTVSDALLDVQQNPNRLLRIKRFGVVMVIITLLGSIVLPYTLSLGIASALLAASIVLYPPLLYPIYWLLMPPLSLGLKLLLGILFYTIVCPAAFFSRILGIDIIQRNIKPEVQSYWIDRKTLLPHGKYMTSQR
jgi:hypothetical protein